MKGKRKLHNAKMVNIKPKQNLKQLRNDKMAWRFIYYDKVKRRRYEDVLEALEGEFFISQARIIDLLMKNKLMNKLLQNTPSLQEIKENSKPFIFEISKEEKEKFSH